MKPRKPDPITSRISWAMTFLDDWIDLKEDSRYAPEKAWALLAAYGALLRFSPTLPKEVTGLEETITKDKEMLLAALQQHHRDTEVEWREKARHLDKAWDFATKENDIRELEMGATTLFDNLDRTGLAIVVAGRISPKADTLLEDMTARQEEDERLFIDLLPAFLSVAPMASGELKLFRSDLEETDLELWLTAEKHRLLAEKYEEVMAPEITTPLSDRDKKAILAKAQKGG